jgi:isopentenyl-diphosphate delta-isomerase
MPDEYLDVIDRNGNPTGISELGSIVHRQGLLHKTIHVWIVNRKGEVLVQKRSQNKWMYPGFWEASVGGHLEKGDTNMSALCRETVEEVGISISPEECIFVCSVNHPSDDPHPNGFIDNEIHDVYIVVKDVDISDIVFQEDEIEEVRFVSLDTLKDWINSIDGPLAPHPEYFPLLIKCLEDIVPVLPT